MIAAVRGEVMVRRSDHVVIDAGGVGYRLAVSAETLKAVPATGRDAFLHTELISREDSLALYGFASEEERDLFKELISVSGVGPKVAIAALSGGAARELLRAIASGDAKRFQAVPGIGKRTSERIIVELREKVMGALEEEVAVAAEGGDARALARDGLVNLGYVPVEAERLLDGLEGDDVEQLLSDALRKAGSSKSKACSTLPTSAPTGSGRRGWRVALRRSRASTTPRPRCASTTPGRRGPTRISIARYGRRPSRISSTRPR
ncbi:MAG TPA: Holliday junction branch migration protein RuvA [Solirubrobacterales bacterium]|nr:Holliday junction branch migration protein RuvA [Solirubrobacterales bacterium]